jgi:hypothetical protein
MLHRHTSCPLRPKSRPVRSRRLRNLLQTWRSLLLARGRRRHLDRATAADGEILDFAGGGDSNGLVIGIAGSSRACGTAHAGSCGGSRRLVVVGPTGSPPWAWTTRTESREGGVTVCCRRHFDLAWFFTGSSLGHESANVQTKRRRCGIGVQRESWRRVFGWRRKVWDGSSAHGKARAWVRDGCKMCQGRRRHGGKCK